jgi:hypothetical protein
MHGEREELGEAELAQLVDYLAGELGPEQREAVRRRLETDVAFAARAIPVIGAWTAEVRGASSVRGAVAREGETRDAWHVVRQRIAAIADGVAEAPDSGAAERGPTEVGGNTRGRGSVRRLPPAWRRRVYRGAVVPVILSFLALVVGVYGRGLYLIFGPGWVQGHLMSAVHHGLHRPVVDVVTNHSDGQLVRFPDGSTATLDVMTWLSYPRGFGDVARNVGLVGRARFTVGPTGPFPFRTWVGPALLEGGTEYTVDYVDPSQSVTAWVTRGTLLVRRSDVDVGSEPPVVVPPGHVVIVTHDFVRVDTTSAPPPTF